MQAAPPLLSFLLILLYHSGWTHGLCKLTKADGALNRSAQCDELGDVAEIETYDLETLKTPGAQDVLVPDFFSNLTNLKHLDLSGGDLRTIEPGSFRGLSNLRSLNLTDNRIVYLELGSVEGLTHLRSLNLRRNAIRQLPAALARLKHLRHLDIHGNPLECNCATLKVRDLLIRKRDVSFKRVVCASPVHMKDTLITLWNATTICSFEKQDREMQNDQAEGSGTDLGFEDIPDDLSEEEEEDDEYVEVNNNSTEKPREPEVETPFPTASAETTSASSAIESTVPTKESSVSTEETTDTTVNSLQSTGDDEEIFFDNQDDKKERTSTTEMLQTTKIKDGLFYPSEDTDNNEGSGEGSGAGHYDEEKTEKDSTNDDLETSFFDLFFGWGGGSSSTPIPSETKDLDLEEEQFINVSSTKLTITEKTVESDASSVTTDATTSTSLANGVEVLQSGSGDKSRSGNVKAEVNSLNDENAAVSTSKQSKKGMGSYIVLAVLLAVVAALIGIAAYRGDICRKKRKRGDVENGTELKDMQKSLLPDGNSTQQPKIASNGNAESIPLVDGAPDGNDAKFDKVRSNDYQTQDAPQPLNGTADHPDPVKPPRKLITSQDEPKSEDRPRVDVNSLRENFLADRTSPAHASESSVTTNNEPNGPPLSPSAQRVKITLQENPDSVPKTPILITRTIAGENLVKTS